MRKSPIEEWNECIVREENLVSLEPKKLGKL